MDEYGWLQLLPRGVPAKQCDLSEDRSWIKSAKSGDDDLLPWGLLPELLEVVLGFVDTETLLTARLTNSAWDAAACSNMRSISMLQPFGTQSYDFSRVAKSRYPRVSKLAIFPQSPGELASCLACDVRLRADHVRLAAYACWPAACLAAALRRFPRLRRISIQGAHTCVGYAELLRALPALEGLQATCREEGDYAALIAHTGLRTLDVNLADKLSSMWDPHGMHVSALEHVVLPRLNRLRVHAPPAALQLIRQLTCITCLTWAYDRNASDADLTPLAELTGLKALRLKPANFFDVWHPPEAHPLSALTGLTRLFLAVAQYPEPSPGSLRLLAGMTALQELKLWGSYRRVAELASMPTARLRRLELGPAWHVPDAVGLAVLRGATALTYLTLHLGAYSVDTSLAPTLGTLTRLRSLNVQFHIDEVKTGNHGNKGFEVRGASDIAPLTGLTSLVLRGAYMRDADVAAVAGLTNLQTLQLEVWREWGGPAPSSMATLSALSQLQLTKCEGPLGASLGGAKAQNGASQGSTHAGEHEMASPGIEVGDQAAEVRTGAPRRRGAMEAGPSGGAEMHGDVAGGGRAAEGAGEAVMEAAHSPVGQDGGFAALVDAPTHVCWNDSGPGHKDALVWRVCGGRDLNPVPKDIDLWARMNAVYEEPDDFVAFPPQ